MKIAIKYTFVGIISLMLSSFAIQDSSPQVDQFFTTELRELGNFDLSSFTIEDLTQAFNRAAVIVNDSSATADPGKGHLYLAILSDHIKKEIKAGNINTKKRNVRFLLREFEAQQYFIHQPKVPNFLKLMYNACQGNFSYIYSRFKVSGFFIPVIVVFILGLAFIVLNALKKIPWKYTKLANKIVLIGLALFVILSIIFKLTCNDFVQTDSFYGIPF